MIRKNHLILVASHSIRHGLRSGSGLISIFITLICGLAIAKCTLTPLEVLQKKNAESMERLNEIDDPAMRAELAAQASKMDIKHEIGKKVVELSGTAIDYVVDPPKDDHGKAQIDYLTKERPAMVTIFLIILVLFVPLLTCLAGFNQTSSDISSKGLRFLLIRTERGNIFLGRLIGTYLFSLLVYLLLFVVLGLYMTAQLDVHPKFDMVAWLAQGYLRVMIFSAPYMALCAWISCAIDSAFGSLVIALLFAYVIPLVVGIGSRAQEAIGYAQYLTPWGWKWWLFEPIGLRFFAGIGVMAAFTAGLVWVGLRYFGKRDL